MKKLQRPELSNFLDHYQAGVDKWTIQSPNSRERAMIWQHLGTMQQGYCAYCESSITQKTRHIEHFFHKGMKADGTKPYEHLTFAWDNLFGCCESKQHCGHYKDKQGKDGPGPYDADNLIKPDTDNPASYLDFVKSGNIRPKSDLTQPMRLSADETIRVLHLKEPGLIDDRKKLILKYQSRMQLLEQNIEFLTVEQYEQILNQIELDINNEPYQTAIRQVVLP